MEKININTASLEELITLKHIGLHYANEIITHRPYTSIQQLSPVLKFTADKMNEIFPMVYVDEQEKEIHPDPLYQADQGEADTSSLNFMQRMRT